MLVPDIIRWKMRMTSHIIRGLSEPQLILEGKIRVEGGRRTWVDNLKKLTGRSVYIFYKYIKRLAEKKDSWKS